MKGDPPRKLEVIVGANNGSLRESACVTLQKLRHYHERNPYDSILGIHLLMDWVLWEHVGWYDRPVSGRFFSSG